jgi:hypothetical protein
MRAGETQFACARPEATSGLPLIGTSAGLLNCPGGGKPATRAEPRAAGLEEYPAHGAAARSGWRRGFTWRS